jgi:hypothetical protein
MNQTQVQTTAAPLIAVAAGYAAAHGWLGLGQGDWGTVITALGAAAVVLWPALVTRAQSLKNTVGNMDHTTVVTDKASADALPENKSVVAVTPEIVAAIKKAQ